MSVIPAHLMRSVGGGYDNESLAISCMVATFLFWIRSIRNDSSWYWGVLAGLAQVLCSVFPPRTAVTERAPQVAMAAAWGGYIFVCNMIGVHAVTLVFLGYWTPGLTKAYLLWWAIGAFGASQIPGEREMERVYLVRI